MVPSRLPRIAPISAWLSSAKNRNTITSRCSDVELGEGRPDLVDFRSLLDHETRVDGIDLPSGLIVQRLGDASSPSEIDHGVAGDAEQPGPEREPSLFVSGKSFDHLEEDLLQDVFAVRRLGHTNDDEAVDAFGVHVVQSSEGLGIACLRTVDERVDFHVIDN